MSPINKILVLISFESPPFKGGISKMFEDTKNILNTNGYKIIQITPNYKNSFHQKKDFSILKHHNLKIIQIIKVLFLLKKENFDLIHAFDWRASFIAFILRLFYGVEYVVSLHGSELNRFKNSIIYRKILGLFLFNAKYVICNSNFTQNILFKYYKYGKSIVLYPYCKYTTFNKNKRDFKNQIEKTKPVAITVGRLVERKGHISAIKLLEELNNKHDIKLDYLIVGKKEETKYFQKLKEEIKNSNIKILILSDISDDELAYLYSLSDLNLLLATFANNRVEGFGYVVIEAAQRGVPSIVTNNGGSAEIVENFELGWTLQNLNISDLKSYLENPYTYKEKLIKNTFSFSDKAKYLDALKKIYFN